MKSLIAYLYTLLTGLICVSTLGCGIALAEGPDVLHVRTTDADYRDLGLHPKEIQPWEDGRRTTQSGKNYEWWYFDAILADGSIAVVTFSDNIDGAKLSEISIEFISHDHEHTTVSKKFSDKGTFARDHCDVHFDNNFFTGDLNTYHIHVEADNSQRLGLDLALHRTVPSFRAATGVVSAGAKYFAWFNAVPRGDVTGTVSLKGVPKQVAGVGYHDHNWGNVPPNELLDTWWWGRGNAGTNTVVAYVLQGKRSVGGTKIVLDYVGSGDGVKVQSAGGGAEAIEGAKQTHPDPKHPRPVPLSLAVTADGYRTDFPATGSPILSLDLLQGQASWKRLLARAVSMKPWYTRFASPVTLSGPEISVARGEGILEYYELK